MSVRFRLAVWVALAVAPCTAFGKGYRFATPIIDDDAVSSSFSGINDAGQIVGFFDLPDFVSKGFVLDGDSVELIEVDGAEATFALGINERGDVVGSYFTPDFAVRPFLDPVDADLEELPIPGDEVWAVDAIDSGLVVGFSSDGIGSTAFLFDPSGDQISEFDHPSASEGTFFSSINDDGLIAGSFLGADETYSGFLITTDFADDDETPVESVHLPLTTDTEATAANTSGQLVGYYSTREDGGTVRSRGFVMSLVPPEESGPLGSEVVLETVDFPGASETVVNDVNDRGVVVGSYYDELGLGPFGFIATPIPDLTGDVDFDGDVDLEDFNLLKANFGASAVGVPGDVDGDFAVTPHDVELILGAAVQVPEPGRGCTGPGRRAGNVRDAYSPPTELASCGIRSASRPTDRRCRLR